MDLIAQGNAKRQKRSKSKQSVDNSLIIKALQKLVDSFIRLAQACQYPGVLLPKQFNSSIGSAHMKQRNQKLVTGLSAAMLLMGANVALAETVTVPATVTVNNAINFTFTGTLDFGQVRAKASPDANKCIGLQLPAGAGAAALVAPTGTTTAYDIACTTKTDTTNGLSLQAVGGTPARPVFTIAGVAPFTNLKLTLPGNRDLTAATGPGTAQFKLVDFTGYKTSGTAGAVTNVSGITTDAGGGATFNVGATLITDSTGPTTSNYQDLAYTGSFDVIVTY